MEKEYRIYEHIIGFPSHMDTIMEDLEECLQFSTAEKAEDFIKRCVPDIDIYGRKRNVYVYRLGKNSK